MVNRQGITTDELPPVSEARVVTTQLCQYSCPMLGAVRQRGSPISTVGSLSTDCSLQTIRPDPELTRGCQWPELQLRGAAFQL